MTATAAPVINPTAEDAYWRAAFRHEAYYKPDCSYDDYGPAYRVGYTGPLRREGSFEALEPLLREDWDRVKGRSRLSWDEARPATRAAWLRATAEDA